MRVLAVLALLSACTAEPTARLGVTLADGQVLIGAVETPTIQLQGGLGILEIPVEHIGMVVPTVGSSIAQAEGTVTVWLRNGSELSGIWTEPQLSLTLGMGGEDIGVDVPIDDVQAIQLRDGEQWPAAEVFRVQTTWGDDFLVDAATTRIAVVNELGTFAPWLSECVSAVPVSDPEGPWRLQLHDGTVVIGTPAEDALELRLPLGPSGVSVPLATFVSLQRQTWAPKNDAYYEMNPSWGQAPLSALSELAPTRQKNTREQALKPSLSRGDGWFDNRALDYAKQ